MKNKNRNIAVIVLMMLVFIAGAAFVFKPSKEDKEGNETDFSGCSVLRDSCSDKSCDLYYLCNEQDTKNCKVYDCKEKYGIETTDGSGITEKKYREKFDRQKAELDVKECGGRIAVIEEKECKDDTGEISVQVLSGQNCNITGFTLKIDGQDKMVPFQKEDAVYKLKINKCGEVSDVTAIGEGGVQIKESY